MSWPRVARVVVAFVGLGCALAIFVYTRNRPQHELPPRTLADPAATAEDHGATENFLRVGKSPVKLTCATRRGYADGRMRCENAKIEGLEDTRFTITAPVLETRRKAEGVGLPDGIDLSGPAPGTVVLATDDGLRLASEGAHYDTATGQLTMPGPVTFSKGRMSGKGVGATYEREADAFTILDQASARVEPDATGKGRADATSKRMSLFRGQHTLRLDETARIEGEAQTLTANQATVLFTDDEQAIKFVELRGTAKVQPRAGGAPDRPAMTADNITMAFYEDGLTLQHATLTGHAVLTIAGATSRAIHASWIDVFTGADGQTLTGLQAKDRVVVELAATAGTVGRRITAASLVATGVEKKGLTSARFEGSPQFEELPSAAAGRGAPGAATAPSRKGTATTLVLTLAGQLDAIQRADFLQNAEFRDGNMTGKADVAQYDDVNGKLALLPDALAPRRRSSVETPDLNVDATTRIDVETGTQNLRAQGTVTTRMKRTPGSAARSPGALFDGDSEVRGSADKLEYVKATGNAIYTGAKGVPARLVQGETSVSADRLVFNETSRNLDASGSVDSRWMFAEGERKASAPAAGSKSALQEYRVRAETLHYEEAGRVAVYVGKPESPVVLNTDDGEIDARKLTFTLAAASRALESMRAEGDVFAKLSGGHEAVGAVLVYVAATEIYTLHGNAKHEVAQVKSRIDPAGAGASATPACRVAEGLTLELNRRTGEVGQPGRTQAPRSGTETSCTQPLRRVK